MLRIRLHMPEYVYAASLAPAPRAAPEWPPAPWRIAAALLAGAATLEESSWMQARAALARLEQAEPPTWWLPPEAASSSPRQVWAAMVAPDSDTKPRDVAKVLDLSAAVADMADHRTKYPQLPVRVSVSAPTAWMDVDVTLSEVEVDALSMAALAVPYVGQSTHPAELGVLTPDETGGWRDHTSPDGTCPEELATPGDQHLRWTPSNRPDAVPVRCWAPGMLQVLDEDHHRRSENRVGVAPRSKGRTVHYASTRRRDPGEWRLVGLRRPTRDVVATLQAVPAPAGAVLPIIARDRLVGLLCAGPEMVLRAHQALPDSIDSADHRIQRAADRFQIAAHRWRSATPVAAHPDGRVARAQLQAELGELGRVSQVQLHAAGPVPHPVRGLSMWHVDVQFVDPLRGPLRCGAGADSGAGVLAAVADDGKE